MHSGREKIPWLPGNRDLNEPGVYNLVQPQY